MERKNADDMHHMIIKETNKDLYGRFHMFFVEHSYVQMSVI